MSSEENERYRLKKVRQKEEIQETDGQPVARNIHYCSDLLTRYFLITYSVFCRLWDNRYRGNYQVSLCQVRHHPGTEIFQSTLSRS